MAKPGRRQRQTQPRTALLAPQGGGPAFVVPYRDVVARAQELLKSCEGAAPDIWAELEAVRTEARTAWGWPEWPEWCWLPVEACWVWAFRRTVPGAARAGPAELKEWRSAPPEGEKHLAVELQGAAWQLAPAASWRVTRGIYRFHPELRRALLQTPVGEVAPEVFLRLPEWCVYLDLDDSEEVAGGRANGFFAHLDWNPRKRDAPVLRLELAVHGGRPQRWFLCELPLRHRTLAEAWSEFGSETHEQKGTESEWSSAMRVCLPLLLYLASDVPEVRHRREPGRRPERRGPERDSGGPNWWEVGYRIGAVLGRAREPRPEVPAEAPAEAGRAPVPHVRRAHYHLYWTGSGRREPRVRWLHPILVGDRDGHELPPTIRRVDSPPS
jgi:hypothetical protein